MFKCPLLLAFYQLFVVNYERGLIIAYNLMAVFRLFILKSEVQHTLSTLQFKVFATGAYFQMINGEYHPILNFLYKKEGRYKYNICPLSFFYIIEILFQNNLFMSPAYHKNES